MKFFENRRNRGAISIFLVMILVPTMLLSAVLIDGSRMASAKAMTQEAADLAAASALTSYNQKLKDEYGLFAIKDPDKLETVYKQSLEATLLASGLSGDEEYSEKLWGIMKSAVGAGSKYAGKDFLNLYDFTLDSCFVQPIYPLAEKEVLQNQMVEYAKFRGIYIMADRMDILLSKSSLQKEAEDNKEASQVMEKKMDVDQNNAEADKALGTLREKIRELNEMVSEANYQIALYADTYLPAYMEKIKLENTDIEGEIDQEKVSDYENVKNIVTYDAQTSAVRALEVLEQAQEAKRMVEEGISRLETFVSENQGKDNESISSMVSDAEKNISNYKTIYLPAIDRLLKDERLNQLSQDMKLARNMRDTMSDIEDAVKKYADELAEQAENADDSSDDDQDGESEEEEITEYYYYYLDYSGSDQSENTVINGGNAKRNYRPALYKVVEYFIYFRWDEINPTEDSQSTADNSQSGKIDENFASEQSSKEDESGKEGDGTARSEISEADYGARPSKNYASETKNSSTGGFYNTDGDLDKSKKALNGSKDSLLLKAAETTRDEVLSLSYMFGTFKTRMTGVSKFSGKNMPQSEKDSKYMPKWRYAHDEGEIDMRFEPKRDRKTALRSEIEYLIFGNRTDAENETAVYATIYAERLANNIGAMYMEKKVINPACHTAAIAASAATGGVIPETVFFWIFLTAWATAETTLDMYYLIDCGYKIPLLKNNKNLLLTDSASGAGNVSNYGNPQSAVFVTYEDYLLLELLIAGSEKRIMRSADLIQFGMRINGEDSFSMDKAYTYLKADSGLSIRYLFGSTAPFQTDYEKGGVTGRMKFSNHIYQGY